MSDCIARETQRLLRLSLDCLVQPNAAFALAYVRRFNPESKKPPKPFGFEALDSATWNGDGSRTL
jgi:hypothetical protein